MSEFQNIPLLPGEQIVFAADFTPSPILRSNKSGLVVTQQRVAVVHPQHIFLFFKVGHVVSSSPIETICEVSVGRLLSRGHLRMAMYAGFFALFLMFTSLTGGVFGIGAIGALSILLAFALFGVAAFQLWLARRLGLTLQHSGGGTLALGVDTSEYQAMQNAASAIQQLMLNTRPSVGQPNSTGTQGQIYAAYSADKFDSASPGIAQPNASPRYQPERRW